MKKFKIALDVDGVICAWYKGICERYNKPYVKLKQWSTPWINKVYPEIEHDASFWKNLPVLNKHIPFEFDCYITSIPDDMKPVREEWLKRNGFPDKPVHAAHDKLSIAKELGINLIVDDKPTTIIEFNKNSDIIGLCYMPEYMADYPIDKFLPQYRSLEKIKKVIEKLEKQC